MNFNLKVLNLLFSLCDEASETPTFLRSLGYKVLVVEPSITVGGTKNSPIKCKPECLLFSESRASVLGIESKSGACHSAEQRGRYDLLKPNHLRSAVQELEREAEFTFQLIYICPESEAASHYDILEQAGSSFALITYDPASGRLALARGTLPDNGLVEGLRAAAPMPWPVEPSRYVQFDPSMTDIEIGRLLLPAVRASLLGKDRSLSPSDFARHFITDWYVLTPSYRGELATRLTPIIEKIVNEAFPAFLQVVPSRRGQTLFKITPQAQKRSRDDRRNFTLQLNRISKEFMTDWMREIERTTREAAKPPELQQFMFDSPPPPISKKRKG